MSSEYTRLVEQGQLRGRGPGLSDRDPKVRKARAAERNRRNTEAKRRAYLVLALRYPDEFAVLLEAERTALYNEKGPLPGDPEEETP